MCEEEVNTCVCTCRPCWWVGELGAVSADGDTSTARCHLLGQGNHSAAAPAKFRVALANLDPGLLSVPEFSFCEFIWVQFP